MSDLGYIKCYPHTVVIYGSPKWPCIHIFNFVCFPVITSLFPPFSRDNGIIFLRSRNNETLFSPDNDIINLRSPENKKQ